MSNPYNPFGRNPFAHTDRRNAHYREPINPWNAPRHPDPYHNFPPPPGYHHQQPGRHHEQQQQQQHRQRQRQQPAPQVSHIPNPFRQNPGPPQPATHGARPPWWAAQAEAQAQAQAPWAPPPRFHETRFRDPHAGDETYAATQQRLYSDLPTARFTVEPFHPPLGRAGNAGTGTTTAMAGPAAIPPLFRLAFAVLALGQLLKAVVVGCATFIGTTAMGAFEVAAFHFVPAFGSALVAVVYWLVVGFILWWVVVTAMNTYVAFTEYKRPAVHYVLRHAPQFLGYVSTLGAGAGAGPATGPAVVPPLATKGWTSIGAAASAVDGVKSLCAHTVQQLISESHTRPVSGLVTDPSQVHNRATPVEQAVTAMMGTLSAWLPEAALYIKEVQPPPHE